MVEFFTILSASLGAATTVTKLATQLSGVRDETGTVVDQIRRINEDIILARHLRYRKKLNLADRDAARIDRIVKDTENAVLKIAQQVERTRVGVAANGTVNLYDRFDWVLRRSAAVTGNQQNLQTCHHSLLGEISYLRQKESIIAPEPLSHLPPPYEDVVQTASKPAALWTTTPDASSIPYKDSSENENENEDEDEDEDDTSSESMDGLKKPVKRFSPRSSTKNMKSPCGKAIAPTKLHPERAYYEDMQQLAKWK